MELGRIVKTREQGDMWEFDLDHLKKFSTSSQHQTENKSDLLCITQHAANMASISNRWIKTRSQAKPTFAESSAMLNTTFAW
eukprot:4089702-Amphidinium_carterae.1